MHCCIQCTRTCVYLHLNVSFSHIHVLFQPLPLSFSFLSISLSLYTCTHTHTHKYLDRCTHTSIVHDELNDIDPESASCPSFLHFVAMDSCYHSMDGQL